MHINVIATRSRKAQPDAVPDTKEAADAADSNVETDTDAVADTGTHTFIMICVCASNQVDAFIFTLFGSFMTQIRC